jgi:hypothetical protein
MYVIIPNGTLSKGDPFPMVNIPTDVNGTDYTDFELEDFQWWAYSKPFNDWFKSSGRSWQASESEIMSDGDALVERWKAEKVKEGKPIMSFLDFVNESVRSEYTELFEKGPEGDASGVSEGTGITQQDQIKFLFAYTKLVKQGAIQTTFDTNTDFNEGDEKAFFLTVVQNDEEAKALNMKAMKFKAKTGASSGAGRLTQATEMYPGPYKIPPDATSNFIVTKIQQDLSSLGTWAQGMLAGWGVYTVAGVAGSSYLAYRVFNGWKFASAVKAIGNAGGQTAAKTIADLLKGGRAARGSVGIFGKLGKSVGSYIFKEGLGTAKAFKAAKTAWKAGVKPAMRLLNTSKAFLRGTVAGGARFVPVLGWVLLAVDAVGSMINWYSDNQAPRAGEAMELFDAKEVFSPSSIEVGESIVLCWSQPDNSSWGVALSWVVSNMGETRTVLEMTKIIGDSSGYSVFILQSANSESLNEQLKGNLLTLIALPNSAKLDNGYVDADEVQGKICSVKREDVNAEGDAIPVPFDFEGVCNWDTLVSAVESSEGVMFKSDPNAPATYEFNFEDIDGDRINVVGTLVTDDDLANLTTDDIERIFYGGIDTGNTREAREDEGESEGEGEEENTEDLETEETNESSRVVTFESFKSGRLYESGDEEDTSDVLDSFQGPAVIAIYVCDQANSKAYASKEIGRKKRLPQFTNFAINPDDYNAGPGTTIDVDVNSDEDIEDPKAGYAEYREGGEVDREVVVEEPVKGDGEEGTGEVQAGDGKIIAPDITKKERKHSTVIKDGDKDGGINLMDEFLTTEDKSTLGISDWDKITMVKARYDNNGEISKIIIRNKDAQFMKKSKEYTPDEIESFEIAKKLLQSAQSRLEVKK